MSTLHPQDPILLVDDEPAALKSFEVNLHGAGFTHIVSMQDSRQVLPYIREHPVEMLLLDLTMPHLSGQEILREVSENHPDLPVVVVTGLNDVNIAVECMKAGAVDYLLKPVERNRLLSAVRMVIELKELRRQYGLLKQHLFSEGTQNPSAFSHIITRDKRVTAILKYIEAVSGSGEPILIIGDTGTGKELFARAVHNVAKPKGPFIAVNVAGLDDTMFTDTLFGHKRGAFTSAGNMREGLVEKAQGGTLFLDEIGDLTQPSQVKLLRLIQEKEYYPLGSDVPKCTDSRVVVATNKDLKQMIAEGEFRKDLYFRLAVHQINIPLLKDRRDDIPLLVHHFLDEAASAMGKNRPTPPAELYMLLDMYHFPGNVRELRSMIFDAVSQHQSKVLSLSIFKRHMGLNVSDAPVTRDDSHLDRSLLSSLDQLPTLREMEDLMIQEALERSKGNQSVAAEILGVTRQTLCNRIRKKK